MLTALMMIVYTAIALFAAVMTYDEQCQKSEQNVLCKGLGFLACAVWPVTVLAVVIAAKTQLFDMSPRQVPAFKDV